MRKFFLIILLICLAVFSVGCFSSNTPSMPVPDQNTDPNPVKVTLWGLQTNDQRQIAFEESIKAFNQKHADIQIIPYYYENEAYKNKMRVAMVSGNMPDIFYYWFGESFTRMIESNIVVDLTDMLTEKPDFKNQFYPEALQYASYNEQVYGIPHSVQHVQIWYNKTIFAKYNVQPPETWEELINIIKTLKENQISPISVAGKDRWPLLHWFSYLAHRIGGPSPFNLAVEGEGDFTHPSFVQAAVLFRQLIQNDAFIPGFLGLDMTSAEERFLSGDSAMYMQGDWIAGKLIHDKRQENNIGYFQFPTVNGMGVRTEYHGGYSSGWAISKTTNRKEAFDAISFIMSEDQRKKYVEASGAPTSIQAMDISNLNLSPATADYLHFINENVTGYFGFYDQEIDHQRAQLLMDAVVTFTSSEELSKEEIREILSEVR